MRNESKRSIINYTGNKFKLLPVLQQYLPQTISEIVELFCGSCVFSLNISAISYICNDNIPQLIELYQYIKECNIEELIQYLHYQVQKFQLSSLNKQGYLDLRTQYNHTRYIPDLILLVTHSFLNYMRFNSKGGFNVPFGNRNRSGSFDDRLRNFKEFIEKTTFLNKDFREVKIQEGSFVFVDPPYLLSTATYNTGWTIDDDHDLFDILDELTKRNVKRMMTNFVESKGKIHQDLIEWLKNYDVIHLNQKYHTCNYQRTEGIDNEVAIINYEI